MEAESRIDTLIGPAVEELGYDLVRVHLSGQTNICLQVMAEPLDGSGMTVEGCARISRAISAILEEQDPISGAYTLEVSSPGLDRPLVKLKDYERFAGNEVKVELSRPQNGQRRFRGQLLGVIEGDVRLLIGDEEKRLPHVDIMRSKLVMSDELLSRAQEGEKQ